MIRPHAAVPPPGVPEPSLEPCRSARTIHLAANLAMPIQIQATLRIDDRRSARGVRGALDGAIVLAGLGAVLGFSGGSRMRNLGERSVLSEAALISAGDWFVMPGARFHAPIARGSPIQIQFRDYHSALLTESLSLGRFGDTCLSFCASLRVPVAAFVEIATDDRNLATGSPATIAGKLVFTRGIVARCAFRRVGDRGDDGQVLLGSADMVAVGAGHEIGFATRLPLTPPPARPLKSIGFVDGYGYRFAGTEPLPWEPAASDHLIRTICRTHWRSPARIHAQ
jgi:hypothetical protein